MESDIEEGLLEERQVSRYTVALGCAGMIIVAAGFAGFILYVGDMFSKKIWI
jgi:hypothetical protein